MDRLGPYSVTQLRDISSLYEPTKENGTVVYSAIDAPAQATREALEKGIPIVLLWRDTPSFGHFILLHIRGTERRPDVELFDPLGTTSEDDSWASYMDDPNGLNGGGLRPLLQEMDATGYTVSFNHPHNAPQEDNTNSCGLWCLLRSAFPNHSPSRFAAMA